MTNPHRVSVCALTAAWLAVWTVVSSDAKPACAGASKLLEEEYHAVYMAGAKCGYMHVQSLAEGEGADRVIRTRTHSEMAVKRFGQSSRSKVTVDEYEKPDGTLLRVAADLDLGGAAMHVVGKVEGKALAVTVTTVAGTRKQTLTLDEPITGSQGLQNRLRDMKPEPGQTLSVRTFDPSLRRIVTFTAKVIGQEMVELLRGRKRKLWKIEARLSLLPQVPIAMWADEKYNVWKQFWAPIGGITYYRVSAAEALAPSEEMNLDLALRSLVKLDRPLPNPYALTEAVYDVQVSRPDGQASSKRLTDLFGHEPGQAIVKDDGAGSIRLRVRRHLPAKAGPPKALPAEYLQPNAYIQSDDPLVVRLAAEAAGDATDPLEVCRRLTAWVRTHITEKNYSTGFATAADVARQRQGDCSEHGVLLAALARARGVPSRVAVGLIYLQPGNAFAYHMWTEVHIGEWVGVDGTGGWIGVPPTHVKLADSSMAEGSGLGAILPVIELIGRIQMRLVSYKH